MNFTLQNLSANITKSLNERSLTLADLAKRSGVARTQLDNVIFSRSCSAELLVKIAHGLEISVEELTTLQLPINDPQYADTQAYSEVTQQINVISQIRKINLQKSDFNRLLELAYEQYVASRSSYGIRLFIEGAIAFLPKT